MFEINKTIKCKYGNIKHLIDYLVKNEYHHWHIPCKTEDRFDYWLEDNDHDNYIQKGGGIHVYVSELDKIVTGWDTMDHNTHPENEIIDADALFREMKLKKILNV